MKGASLFGDAERYMSSENKNTQYKPKNGYNRGKRGKRPYYGNKNRTNDKLPTEEAILNETLAEEAVADTSAASAVSDSPKPFKKPRSKYNKRANAASETETSREVGDRTETKEHSEVKHHSEDKNRYRTVPDYWYEEEKVNEKPEEKAPKAEPDPASMIEIVGVKFKENGKIYYFAPMGYECPENLEVIVETARGIEFGIVAIPNKLEDPEVLVAPLRPVVRIATPTDKAKHDENVRREAEAAKIWDEKVAEHGLEMKLIDAEYTFDNSKLTFYFSADGRVDFRELVKSLASVFRTRIELRQIGIRDEAKMLGGLGICGRPFCCSTFLYDFNQVSIRMAKEQNLSLNSAKISGTCGRLMCCLRYECEAYEEEMKRTPKVDSIVKTPDGVGFVIEASPLTGQIKVKMGDADDAPVSQFSRDVCTVIGKRRGAQNQHSEGDDSDFIPDTEL